MKPATFVVAFTLGFIVAVATGEADMRKAFGFDSGPRWVQAR